MGVVTGGGTYAQGTTITIGAIPNTGYHFERWSDNNAQNPRNITVNADIELTAYFAVNFGIDDTGASEIIVYSKDKQIYIKEAMGKDVSVFNVDGRLIATTSNVENFLTIPVPVTGVYFVKVGDYFVKKVIVKQ